MKRNVLGTLSASLLGLLFGAGLIVSGMSNPARVAAFLDITGVWNPSLALVMVAAIAVAAPAFAWVRRHPVSLRGEAIKLPARTNIDTRLLTGAALFGVGWGLSGICPGPALVLLGAFDLKALVFVAALIAGSFAADAIAPRKQESDLPKTGVR